MTERVHALRHRLVGIAHVWLNLALFIARLYSLIVHLRLQRRGPGLRLRVTTTIDDHKNIVIGENFVSMGHLYHDTIVGACRSKTTVQ